MHARRLLAIVTTLGLVLQIWQPASATTTGPAPLPRRVTTGPSHGRPHGAPARLPWQPARDWSTPGLTSTAVLTVAYGVPVDAPLIRYFMTGTQIVTGTGFAAREVVDLYWDYAPIPGVYTPTAYVTATASAGGVFSARLAPPIDTSWRSYVQAIYAVGRTSHRQPWIEFQMDPLVLTPAPAVIVPDQTVVVTAAGFLGHELVQLYWNGDDLSAEPVLTTTADGLGNITATLQAPLDTAPDVYHIVARGEQSTYYADGQVAVFNAADAHTGLYSYWIPWYDSKTTGISANYLMLANPDSTSPAFATVTINGQAVLTTTVLHGATMPVQFAGRQGPLQVLSTIPLLVSDRLVVNGHLNELPAVSPAQLGDDAWFTWYDLKSPAIQSDWIVAVNPNPITTSVQVTVSGKIIAAWVMPPFSSQYVSSKGAMAGPVHVFSNGPVLASQIVQSNGDIAQVPGQPARRLSTDSWFSYFDQHSAIQGDWVMVSNPNAQPITYHVRIAGVDLTPHGNMLPAYATVPLRFNVSQGGPVEVTATGPVLASQRVLANNDVHEITGVPRELMSASSWFDWYDNAGAVQGDWIFFVNPNTISVAVHVWLGQNALPRSITLGPGQMAYIPPLSSGDRRDGPVHVAATAPIFTSQRVLMGNNFVEIPGASADLTINPADAVLPHQDEFNSSLNPYEGRLNRTITSSLMTVLSASTDDLPAPAGHSLLYASPIIANNVWYVATSGITVSTEITPRTASVMGFDLISGGAMPAPGTTFNDPILRQDGAGILQQPVLADGLLYVPYTGGLFGIYGGEANVTETLRAGARNGPITFTTPPVVSNGLACVGGAYQTQSSGQAGAVTCLDYQGNVIWSNATGHDAGLGPVTSLGITQNRVLAYTGDGTVTEFSLSTGQVIGSPIQLVSDEDGAVARNAPVILDGVAYSGWDWFQHSSGLEIGAVMGLDVLSGQVVYTYTNLNPITAAPAAADGVLYVGDSGGLMSALDVSQSNGAPLWTYDTTQDSGGGAIQDTPALANGILYFGTDGGALFALDRATGAYIDTIQSYDLSLNNLGPIIASPRVVNGSIFVNWTGDTQTGATGGFFAELALVQESSHGNAPPRPAERRLRLAPRWLRRG